MANFQGGPGPAIIGTTACLWCAKPLNLYRGLPYTKHCSFKVSGCYKLNVNTILKVRRRALDGTAPLCYDALTTRPAHPEGVGRTNIGELNNATW